MRIGTWNVRKLKQLGKLDTVCREMSRSKIQILGIAETNWNNCGSFVSGDSFKVVYSGKEVGYSHGIAIILAKEAANALIGYSPISDRILKVCIKAKPYNLSIVQCYAPTSTASDDELEEFYNQLQETLDAIPSRDIKIVMGDLNAKVGTANTATPTHGTCGLGIRNERGETLIDFCKVNDLVIANTLFDQHPRRLYTWTSPDRTIRNQIDYIMIEQKWKSCLKDARTLPGADCNSDHQLLSARIRMRLKKLDQPPPTLRLDFSTLGEKYKVDINNKFESLLECETEEIPPNDFWKLGKECLVEVAKQTIQKRKKIKNDWISEETRAEIEKRRCLKGTTDEYKKQNATVQRMMRKDKNQQIDRVCKKIEENSITNSTRDLYRGIKDLTKKFKPTIDTIKDENGNALCNGDDVKERWKSYCEDLYKINDNLAHDNVAFDQTEEEPPPLRSEIQKAINDLKNNKSTGIDEVAAELVKNGGENVVEFFHVLCKKIWKDRKWPEDWITSVFVPIPKKGDVLECSNNRTISLISHCSKILLKVIAGRLKGKLDEEIADEQCGFRANKGTRDQILNLKLIMEKHRERCHNLYMCFIDYRKAFDTVDHETLWKALFEMGFPTHIIHLIKDLYDNQKAVVRTTYGMTDFFNIGQGVRQGCILSPHLFNVYSEKIMREALDGFKGSIKVGGRTVSNLRYADDIVLIAGSMQELEDLVTRVKVASEQAGLMLNTQKTKVMKMAGDPDNMEMRDLAVNGEVIETVDNFIYLGANFTNDCNDSKEIRRRLAIARSAVVSLSNIWKDRSITLQSKIRILHTLVFPVATYGCECWVLKKCDRNRLTSFEIWCYRRIMRISWRERKTNEWVLERIGQATLINSINKRKLSFIGHVARSKGLGNDILSGMVDGKRKRGRPRRKLENDVEDLLGMTMAELLRKAQDRDTWRTTIACATAGQP